MKRVLSLIFAGFFVSLIGTACDQPDRQSREGMPNQQQEQHSMNPGQGGVESPTQPPAEQTQPPAEQTQPPVEQR